MTSRRAIGFIIANMLLFSRCSTDPDPTDPDQGSSQAVGIKPHAAAVKAPHQAKTCSLQGPTFGA
jgi:hypothetical protein